MAKKGAACHTKIYQFIYKTLTYVSSCKRDEGEGAEGRGGRSITASDPNN